MADNTTRNSCPLAAAESGDAPPDAGVPDCPLKGICEARRVYGVSREDVQFTAAAGEVLFGTGDTCHGVYIVRSGAFKKVAVLERDQRQVLGFRFPGEVLGMEGLGDGYYPYTAVALQSASVCRVDVSPDGVQRGADWDLLAAMSRQLQRVQWAGMLLRIQNAEQRIIRFLLDVASHVAAGSGAGAAMKLPMSRKDIANYLGVAVETVSRVLHRLQEAGLLVASGRRMALLDRVALADRLGNGESCMPH